MEPDSTTFDGVKSSFPFLTDPGNLELYKNLTENDNTRNLESQIIERLQKYGLIPTNVKCPSNSADCLLTLRNARVVDRLQWVCDGCGKKVPVRKGSFFFRLPCSILQTLQTILAWCEDADLNVVAEYFGIKLKVATQIYDKLDDLAIKEHKSYLLGGENAVVLAEMYPDCMNRLSPDTSDQTHVHRILMLADTNFIPTRYQLQVIKEADRNGCRMNNQAVKLETEQIIHKCTKTNSIIVTGPSLQNIDGMSSVQHLSQYCDPDMQHFLTTKMWRQAVTLCAASRDLCADTALAAASASASAPATHCARTLQRYLHAALYRITHHTRFYDHTLKLIAREYKESTFLE